MEPRIIKTDEQYRRYLAEIEELAARDPKLDSAEGGTSRAAGEARGRL